MKIAIIADTHDNLANLELFLDQVKAKGIEAIIHCGDVTTPETLEWFAERFAGSIKVACGNAEINREEFAQVAEKHNNLEVFSGVGEWDCLSPSDGQEGKMKIAFAHKPEQVEDLTKAGGYKFVFYGHTHKPWIRQVGETLVANPGTLGGVFTAPTYAILDTITSHLELTRL